MRHIIEDHVHIFDVTNGFSFFAVSNNNNLKRGRSFLFILALEKVDGRTGF